MAKYTIYLALLLVSLSVACGSAHSEHNKVAEKAVVADNVKSGIEDLQWLKGWWQNTSPEGVMFESWVMEESGAMSGRGGIIKGADTMVSELIQLRQTENGVYYIPTVKDQNGAQPVPFKLVFANADSMIFENLEHDFPTRIAYLRVSKTAMVATISGKIQGKERLEKFDFSRVE